MFPDPIHERYLELLAARKKTDNMSRRLLRDKAREEIYAERNK